jgi:type I restriction enzyme S subunit
MMSVHQGAGDRGVPEGWQMRPLLSTVRIANGQVDPRQEPYASMVLIAPNHIEASTGRLLLRETARDQAAISGKYLFSKGDILYSKIRPYLRKAVIADSDGLCSADMYPLTTVDDVVPEFMLAVLLGEDFSKYAESVSVRSGMPKINRVELADYLFALPPIDEQNAIGAALSDADAAIEALDALIAKKRDVKQAAMQRLFSPQKLEDEAATVVRFDQDILMKARIGWQGLTTAEYRSTGLYRLVTGTDITGGAIQWDTCWFVDEDRYSQDKNIQLRVDDVLVTKDGTIGKVGFVQSLPQPATLNSGVFVLRPKSDTVDPRYLRHLMMSRVFREFLDRLAAGSTISHLYQKDFVRFEAPVPSVADQRRMALLLTEMESEVEALVARRDKMRLVKQGMMQELLSGRVRLV